MSDDSMSDDSDELIRNGAYLFKELVKSSHGKINPFRIFSLEELQKATDNFNINCQMSMNSHHVTYRGTIEDRHVEVKIPRFRRHTMMDEAVCLSLIKQRNVVKLLGCCLEREFPIVVNELPPNGTLRKNISKLLWTDRLRIATEIADALSYLHLALNMTHGRLWDADVLFDEFLSAKLSSFDYSQIEKRTRSSDVELDNIRNKLRKREDTHDFGNFLLNLLGIDDGEVCKCKEKVEILKYVKRLNVSEKEMPQVEACIDLLLRCRSSLKLRRWEIDYKRMKEIVGEDELSMEEVARELRCIRSMMTHQPTTDGNESHNLVQINASPSNNTSTSFRGWSCCFHSSSPPIQLTEKMFHCAYQKVLRLMGRGRDSPNNNNEEPEYEFGSVPEHLRDQKNFRFRFSNTCDFPVNDELERKDENLIDNGANLFRELVKSTQGKNNPFRIFSLKELQKATNNFSADPIWSNPFPTYRGIIEDRHVAVKIPRFRDILLNEVVSLSLIKHRNVVKLLGCCLETEHLILVHELPPNGTLIEYIFYKNPVEVSWTDRLRIATEIADALSYLHSELHITHGGLSYFDAVLLDEFHSAKLGASDFSEIQNQAKSSDVETNNGNKSRKLKDVYEFGIILLNLLCIQTDDRRHILKFTKCKEKVEILKYVKRLNVSEKEMPQIEAYIHLLFRCPSSHEERRNMFYGRMKEVVGEDKAPSMEEVARELRCIRSMINPQPTTDGNESGNLSSGAN